MKIIFIDQNKWIELAKVHSGIITSGDSYLAYIELNKAVQSNKIIIPLTIGNILESAKRNEFDSRHDIVRVQAQISNGLAFRCRKSRVILEMENALSVAFCQEILPLEKNWAIVPNFILAFDDENFLGLNLTNKDSPKEQYLNYMLNINEDSRRAANIFVRNESIKLLSKLESRRKLLSGSNIDLRYRAYLAQSVIEHEAHLLHAISKIGRTIEDFLNLDNELILSIFKNIPSLNVEAKLNARVEIEQRMLNSNDIMDMESFCTAIPYANWIIAEKAFCSRARQAKLDYEYNTKITTNFSNLLAEI